MDLKVRMAEAIVYDFVIEDENGAMCLSCNTFGGCKENIKHTSSCIVPEARNFLLNKDDNE